ncbi:MAG TPA: isopentenyl-diphosphate delta-isomerase, partial [Sandaracinaceae bacterium LLY-WYZ-13_1]|nr:isopentenyl-diphosphate delta-isomerase [Sandaracinaceae bacterium LLY-WYZ-13_1]
MSTLTELARRLEGLDRKGYPAYKSVRGAWEGEGFTLCIDHVQGDPFATPSRLRFVVPRAWHGIPETWWSHRVRRVALADLLLEAFADRAERIRCGG